MCRRKKKLYQYCQQRHIPHQRIGKVLVAHNEQEVQFLKNTLIMAQQNGVEDLTWLYP